jgi:hypothetical protein
VNQSWPPDLKAARFKIVSINDDTGWRIDDSDAVPSGY